ncbi:predicted protein [Naegleria gruberi]|uniref:Predicted protein n=1 Tax=Naegleria gruberi TaxID=5762 RepID=D2V821_NAEGR|nr:uncharacterized protein NAEGRDRAFT_47416 [Naegleria gruberi]EFC46969.1 predicted protein [Naegleria gruberi]|eukprot:XP_002679713.1 predicted protein [Naegleria gruberi strain NEG-M]
MTNDKISTTTTTPSSSDQQEEEQQHHSDASSSSSSSLSDSSDHEDENTTITSSSNNNNNSNSSNNNNNNKLSKYSQRLFNLQLRMNQAKQDNIEQLKEEEEELDYKKKVYYKHKNIIENEMMTHINVTLNESLEFEKKRKRSQKEQPQGWESLNSNALYKQHKKRIKQNITNTNNNITNTNTNINESTLDNNLLSYGSTINNNNLITEENKQVMVNELTQKKKSNKKKKNDEDSDETVLYINNTNKHFTKSLTIQGLFQEGFIQSKLIFEQLKSKAIKLDQENDISKKVQYSLNYSKDQWIKFAKQMNENVENVKLTFIPIRESFNLQTVSQRAEQLNTQTQQYFSYIKSRAKELGKDLNEKIKQQDQKTQFTAKIKDMKIEENLSKAGEAVAKNWSAMTSFFKQKVSSNNSNSSTFNHSNNSINSTSYNNQYNQYNSSEDSYYNNTQTNKSLPPLPNKNKQQPITSLEQDDSMWSNDNNNSSNNQPQYSLDTNEDDDFPVEYQNTTTTSTITTTANNNNTNNQQSADSFFD